VVNPSSILAATDFSTDARYATERAALLCADVGIPRGVVLHVIESSWLDTLKHFASLPAEAEVALEIGATCQLDELVAEIRTRSGVALEPRVRVGRALDTILAEADAFDLLAVGARGKHPLHAFAVGSTAERLLRQTRKPILVVRREAVAPYRRVFVAVDFSRSSPGAIAWARAVAPHGELYLVHLVETPLEAPMRRVWVSEDSIDDYREKAHWEARNRMDVLVSTSGLGEEGVHRILEHGAHAPTRLLDLATGLEADLVVVGKHGQSTLERLLLGSVSLHLVAGSVCDVLVTQEGG
jgi:nucleotide-binding universal stress UspA family protein